MKWAERNKSIAVGDRVCYRRAFLQSTGQHTGDVPLARGVVDNLISLGESTLAEITWDRPDLPPRVHVANLSRVTERGLIEPI